MKPLRWKLTKATLVEVKQDSAQFVKFFDGGVIEFEDANGERIQIEMYHRHSNDVGLRIRGAGHTTIDIEPEVSNVVLIKPRTPR